jgi:hypothetical protein
MLWLKLKVDGGIDLHFRVRGSHDLNKGNGDDDWCVIDLVARSSVVNYGLYDDESLEVFDVLWLEEQLEAALKGEGEDHIHYEPIEPYMIFDIYPRKKFGDNTWPFMEWKIILWGDDGAPSESTINLALYDEDMRLLLLYLKYARGAYREGHPEIKKMLDEGNLYGDASNRNNSERIIRGDQIILTEKPQSDEPLFMFCKVSFSDWSQPYTYLGDDDSYREGDRVVVPAGKENRDTIVTIEEIEYLPERLAPYPLSKIKHIKGKAIESVVDEEFTVYNEENISLHGDIKAGCLHLCSCVYGEDYDSEKNYDLSKEDTDKLFRIMSLDEFIKNCREDKLHWMENFFEKNDIHPKTFTW